MYFNNEFKLKKSDYSRREDFIAIVKYYLKRFKNNSNIDIKINKDVSISFIGKNGTCFY